VVERRRAADSPAGAGTSPPSAPRAPFRQRRLLDRAANDNAPTPAQRLLRAVVFVVIGAVIAYVLREILS
jgi:hypothetical protein